MKFQVNISILFAGLILIISAILIYISYIHFTRVVGNVNRIIFDKILDDMVSCLETDFRGIYAETVLLS